MQIEVPFRNPHTGETRKVKVGWSWVLFLFSGVLGLPLFLRGLSTWGAVFAGFWAVNIGVNLMAGQNPEAASLSLGMTLVGFGLAVFMGVKGNEITAKHLASEGWRALDPNSEFTKMALAKWGIAYQSPASTVPVSTI
jgi:hypothetical protein